MKAVISIIKHFLPSKLYHKLKIQIRQLLLQHYERAASQLPQINFHEYQIKHTKLLTNRVELLKFLPTRGIVAEGDFAANILLYNKPEKLYLLDRWNTERYHVSMMKEVESRFKDQIERGVVEVHRGDSVELASLFPDYYFDWIYIDTGHSYQSTKMELLKYSKKVKLDGIIAGHDFVKGNIERQICYGVREAVCEFCVAKKWELLYLTMELDDNMSFAIQKTEAREME
jgi:hypothetical protein